MVLELIADGIAVTLFSTATFGAILRTPRGNVHSSVANPPPPARPA